LDYGNIFCLLGIERIVTQDKYLRIANFEATKRQLEKIHKYGKHMSVPEEPA
jgi:hypothetical protein